MRRQLENGGNYWQYISRELPDRVQKLFPCLSGCREDRYVAGLSMGGYGALKLALNHPEQYAKAASFSGAVHVMKRAKENGGIGQAAFGSWKGVHDWDFRDKAIRRGIGFFCEGKAGR